MTDKRLTRRSRLHLSRVLVEVQRAERLDGPARRDRLRGAARQFMQAGFHDLAKDVRERARGRDA